MRDNSSQPGTLPAGEPLTLAGWPESWPGRFRHDDTVAQAWFLDALRRLVSHEIGRVTLGEAKTSTMPAASFRLSLDYDTRPLGAAKSFYAKVVGGDWPDDSFGAMRESLFYAAFGDSMGFCLPQVIYNGPGWNRDVQVLILEDLGPTHVFAGPDQLFAEDDLGPALKTYARLHSRGQSAEVLTAETPWLFPRYQTRVMDSTAELPAMIHSLTALAGWRPIPGLASMLDETVQGMEAFASLPVTLLHNDIAPQNIAIPRHGSGRDVALIDWEMAGSGPAELDLAYLFMLPYNNTAHVDRQSMLDGYWRERFRLGDSVPDSTERARRQRQADRVMALWLVPVAVQRFTYPFPRGTEPRRYWDSMSAVLESRLRTLAEPCNP